MVAGTTIAHPPGVSVNGLQKRSVAHPRQTTRRIVLAGGWYDCLNVWDPSRPIFYLWLSMLRNATGEWAWVEVFERNRFGDCSYHWGAHLTALADRRRVTRREASRIGEAESRQRP